MRLIHAHSQHENLIQSQHLELRPQVVFLNLMQVDKKTEGGQIRYVVLEKIGQAQIKSVADAQVIQTLNATGAA